MIFEIYHKTNLNTQSCLVANTIILKTNKIRKLLEKYYDGEDSIITNEDRLFKEIISEISKEYLEQCFKEGSDINDQLLIPLVRFLKDAALALSLYDGIKQFNSKVPEEDLMARKPIGQIPIHQFHKIPFVYAHSFLDAIVKVSNTLFVMTIEKKTPYIPEEIRKDIVRVKDEFDEYYPHLRDVRHSWQHIEDRMRGKGKKEKNLENTSLILSSLFGDDLSYTIENGSVESISISEGTLRRVEGYVQKTFDCFSWIKGRSVYAI